MMMSEEIQPFLMILALMWIISIGVALTIAKRERKNKDKVVKLWMGILLGILISVALSTVLPFVFDYLVSSWPILNTWRSTGYYGIAVFAGIGGNSWMIYYYKTSPTKEQYERTKLLKKQIKNARADTTVTNPEVSKDATQQNQMDNRTNIDEMAKCQVKDPGTDTL